VSSTIRPPGGPAAPALGDLADVSEVQPGAIDGVGEAPSTSSTRGVAGTGGVGGTGGVEAAQSTPEALLSRLQAGEVTREQAIEGLVAHALEVHGGARLPPAQRAELEGVLRAALVDDPTLARLLG